MSVSRVPKIKFVVVALAVAGLGLAAHAQTDATADLPKNAKAGMCYARALIPATYQTQTARVMKQEGAERIEVTPARYEWVEEKVLVQEAGKQIDVVPARYEWAEEKVLVTPAQTTWKKGRGPIEKVDNATGEIMCLIEEPAVYKTVRKRVLAEPARTRETTIPAKYQTVRVKKLVSPPTERRVDIPAEFETVTTKKLATDSKLVWKPVLCQTNLNRSVVLNLQRALANAGHSPGPIDGLIGQQTMTAVTAYQRSKGLATGGLTMETLDSLRIRVN